MPRKATGTECLRTFVCYRNVKKCLTNINILCLVKEIVVRPKKKAAPRIGRVTEIVLSQACLLLFAGSMSLLSGLPIYFLRDWLPSLNQAEHVLFFSAYLLLVPVGFLMARQSLRMLRQVEIMSGRRVSFQRRYRKMRRREQRLTRSPLPGPVTPQPVDRTRPHALLANRSLFRIVPFPARQAVKEV